MGIELSNLNFYALFHNYRINQNEAEIFGTEHKICFVTAISPNVSLSLALGHQDQDVYNCIFTVKCIRYI